MMASHEYTATEPFGVDAMPMKAESCPSAKIISLSIEARYSLSLLFVTAFGDYAIMGCLSKDQSVPSFKGFCFHHPVANVSF